MAQLMENGHFMAYEHLFTLIELVQKLIESQDIKKQELLLLSILGNKSQIKVPKRLQNDENGYSTLPILYTAVP